jgi:hypothetical protein
MIRPQRDRPRTRRVEMRAIVFAQPAPTVDLRHVATLAYAALTLGALGALARIALGA